MDVAAERFDWDADNRDKCQKHGVSIAEIEALLRGTLRIAPALKHRASEERFLAIDRIDKGRPLFVVFTLRTKEGERLVRPLSARYMHKEEIEGYEAEGS